MSQKIVYSARFSRIKYLHFVSPHDCYKVANFVLHHTSNIWRRLQILKFLIINLLRTAVIFSLRSRCPPQHLFLGHTQLRLSINIKGQFLQLHYKVQKFNKYVEFRGIFKPSSDRICMRCFWRPCLLFRGIRGELMTKASIWCLCTDPLLLMQLSVLTKTTRLPAYLVIIFWNHSNILIHDLFLSLALSFYLLIICYISY